MHSILRGEYLKYLDTEENALLEKCDKIWANGSYWYKENDIKEIILTMNRRTEEYIIEQKGEQI